MKKHGALSSASFWIDVVERLIRTFAQTVLGALGAGATGITHMPWVTALDLGAGASAISLLLSLASLRIPRADSDTGSMLPPPAETPEMMMSLVHRSGRKG